VQILTQLGEQGGSVLGRDLGADSEGSRDVASDVAATWMLLMLRALALRFVSCALLLRSGPARYALTLAQEDELLKAACAASACTAAHFALLSPYLAVRSRASGLLGTQFTCFTGTQVHILTQKHYAASGCM